MGLRPNGWPSATVSKAAPLPFNPGWGPAYHSTNYITSYISIGHALKLSGGMARLELRKAKEEIGEKKVVEKERKNSDRN